MSADPIELTWDELMEILDEVERSQGGAATPPTMHTISCGVRGPTALNGGNANFLAMVLESTRA